MNNKTLIKYRTLLIYLALAVATFIAFEELRYNDFVDYDDGEYVTQNPYVKMGITGESVIWAFTKRQGANWHPLTMLSHMVDYELFGLNAKWHHLSSLLFHIANTLLLFYALKIMTSAIWPSVFVAAVFGLHPLHVESVAWIAERKDVLSALFWMLTIIAYVKYTKRPSLQTYIMVVLALSLGLMAKPMLVTLPFVLLLLDYWPLERLQLSAKAQRQQLSVKQAIYEKIPLLIIVLVSSVITFIIQQKGMAMESGKNFPLTVRIANASVSYISYIGKMIYPTRLAALYPYQQSLPVWQPIVSLLILAVISAVVIYTIRRQCYLATGWFWYIGTLVPVIGLVQVGEQPMADRYTYLPSIGVFIIVAWGAREFFAKSKLQRTILALSSGLLLAVMLMCTRTQVLHWKNNFTLFGHAARVTENNYVMLNNYAWVLATTGETKYRNPHDAVKFAQRACELTDYDWARSLDTLAAAYAAVGRFDEAVETAEKALKSAIDNEVYWQIDEIQSHLQLFKRHKPYCEKAK